MGSSNHCEETPGHTVFVRSVWHSTSYLVCRQDPCWTLPKLFMVKVAGRRLVTQDSAGGRHYSDPCEPSIKFSTVFQPWFWPGLSFSVSVSSFVWTTADLNIIFVCGSIDFFFFF